MKKMENSVVGKDEADDEVEPGLKPEHLGKT
jgi:hypothetical protein